jgi:hypothetical protein
MLKLSTLSFVLMLMLSSCGSKEKIVLEYNLKQGDILKQNMVMNMDLVQKMMNQEIKISLTMQMKMTFEVKECQGEDYTLEVKFKELKMDAGMPGMETGNISFDSNTADSLATATNISPMFKAVVDKPFEVVMTKTGKPKSVKGLDALFEAMLSSFDENVPENMRQLLIGQYGSQFSEESFKSQLEQISGYFPGKPVGIGDSWNTKMTTSAANFALTIDMKSTLKSIEDDVVNLDFDGTVLTPEGYEQEVNGVKAKVSLKGAQKGTFKINRKTGWIISSDMTMNFNGEIEVMGMKVPVYAASKSTVTGE